MHSIRTEPLVDQGRAHDLRRDAQGDVFVRQPSRGIFCQHQLVNVPPGVGERRRNGVPAVQDDRTIRAGLASAPGRPAAGLAVLSGRLAATAPEVLLSLAIAHGPACVTGS